MLEHHPGHLWCSNIAEFNNFIVGGLGNPPMVLTISAVIRIGVEGAWYQKLARWDFWCAVDARSCHITTQIFEVLWKSYPARIFWKKNGGSSWSGAPTLMITPQWCQIPLPSVAIGPTAWYILLFSHLKCYFEQSVISTPQVIQIIIIYGYLGHLWSVNDVIMSWLRLPFYSNCFPYPY